MEGLYSFEFIEKTISAIRIFVVISEFARVFN